MLVLSRKVGEEIVVGGNVRVTVLEIQGNRIRLGVTAPDRIKVCREEVYRRGRESASSGSSVAAIHGAPAQHAEQGETTQRDQLNDDWMRLTHSPAYVSGCDSATTQTIAENELTNIDPPHILIAEDHDEFRRLLVESFRAQRYEVTSCRNGVELIDQLHSLMEEPAQPSPFDLIISDIRMPGVTGLSVLAGLRGIRNMPPVINMPPAILITAFGDEETHAEARRLGAAAIIDKPFDIATLLLQADEVLRGKEARENTVQKAPLRPSRGGQSGQTNWS